MKHRLWNPPEGSRALAESGPPQKPPSDPSNEVGQGLGRLDALCPANETTTGNVGKQWDLESLAQIIGLEKSRLELVPCHSSSRAPKPA